MLYTEPWNHVLIDNFFDKDTFKYCIQHLESIPKQQNNHTVIKDKRLINYCDNIFTEKFIKINFPNHRPYKSLESVAEVNLCSKNGYYPVHDEAPYKIISAIIYLAPRKARGTKIFNSSKEFQFEVPWQVNRCLAFAGIEGVTWHSYSHNGNLTRATFNYFKKYFNVLQK